MSNIMKVSGCKVVNRIMVDMSRDGAQGYVITCERHDGRGHGPRFVTSLWFDGDTEWCQGYYSKNLSDVAKRESELCRRYNRHEEE